MCKDTGSNIFDLLQEQTGHPLSLNTIHDLGQFDTGLGQFDCCLLVTPVKHILMKKNCKSKTPIDWNKDFLIQVHCKWKSPRKKFSLQYAINIVKKR